MKTEERAESTPQSPVANIPQQHEDFKKLEQALRTHKFNESVPGLKFLAEASATDLEAIREHAMQTYTPNDENFLRLNITSGATFLASILVHHFIDRFHEENVLNSWLTPKNLQVRASNDYYYWHGTYYSGKGIEVPWRTFKDPAAGITMGIYRFMSEKFRKLTYEALYEEDKDVFVCAAAVAEVLAYEIENYADYNKIVPEYYRKKLEEPLRKLGFTLLDFTPPHSGIDDGD